MSFSFFYIRAGAKPVRIKLSMPCIGTANIDLTRASRTFFLKIGYALVL